MEIEVSRDSLLKELQQSEEKYTIAYEEALEVYAKKVSEYSEYVQKYASSPDMQKQPLKFPPEMLTWEFRHFKNAKRAVEAHNGLFLEMDSTEYNNILDNVNELLRRVAGSRAAMMNTIY